MKKIISGEVLKEKLGEAINLLCDTVKTTLGPKGSNVIIDHSTFSPFITNDGVTIAENVESDDPIINTILEIAKEASFKTNEIVGDGTTTTLVLLQSIFNNGMNLIKNGTNPIILKKELDKEVKKIVKEIKTKKMKINKKRITDLLSISANDKEIGNILSDAYYKVKNAKSIKIYEGTNIETKVIHLKGYSFETNIASNYYFLNKDELNIKNAKVLLVDEIIYNLDDIEIIINNIIEEKKDLVIIAKDYNDDFINYIINFNMEMDIKIYLLKSSLYGNDEKYFFDDLKDITNSKIVYDNNFTLNNLGNIISITINKEYTTISFNVNNKVIEKIKMLEKNKIKDNNRLTMLKNGMVNIFVGAQTNTVRRETKMRFDDALCTLNSIENGIIPGGGLVFLELSDKLQNNNNALFILKESLKEPFYTIINNAGLNTLEIEKEIKNKDYKIVYNINSNQYESIYDTKVYDSTNILITSLLNAVSIAGILLTTTSLIINEYSNNLNKENNYTEL